MESDLTIFDFQEHHLPYGGELLSDVRSNLLAIDVLIKEIDILLDQGKNGEGAVTLDKFENTKKNVHLKKIAANIYRFRRKRDSIFSEPEIFGEPSWDIMLDLLAARYEKKSVSISSACIASSAPASTALRWIGILEEKGLVERVQDPNDGRRSFLQLTGVAVEKMETLLGSHIL